jgi:hypothetical protein
MYINYSKETTNLTCGIGTPETLVMISLANAPQMLSSVPACFSLDAAADSAWRISE